MPDPGPPSPPDFTGTEEELHQLISNARFSVTMQEATGVDWVVEMGDVLEAIVRAVYGIRHEKIGPLNGPIPKAKSSRQFISRLRKLSLDFLRSDPSLYPAKHIDKKTFRVELLLYMSHLHGSATGDEMSLGDYTVIAGLLHRGSNCFPILAEQTVSAIASRLYGELGAYFFQNITDPRERAKKILRVAGVDRQRAWNLLKGAESQQSGRAKRGDAG